MIDTVLGAHHAQIGKEIRLAAFERGVDGDAVKDVRARSTSHDEDVLWPLSPTLECNASVGLVGAEHDVRHSKSEPLGHERRPVARATLRETRDEELGNQVVVIEHECCAASAHVEGREEEHVRRIARMDQVERIRTIKPSYEGGRSS